MAVVTLKSTAITNRDAVPLVLTDSRVSRADLKEACGFVTTNSGDTAASLYLIASVPSNARISQILLDNEALGSGCTIDVGANFNTKDGGAVISAAFFASQVDVSGALKATDITDQSGTYTIDKQQMELWQALGQAVDTFTTYDIVVKVHVATAAAGKISLRVRYAE